MCKVPAGHKHKGTIVIEAIAKRMHHLPRSLTACAGTIAAGVDMNALVLRETSRPEQWYIGPREARDTVKDHDSDGRPSVAEG